MSERNKQLSKFLSYVLRHKPEDAGLKLDERGCCPVDTIIVAATKKLGYKVTRDDIEVLCEPSDNPNEKTRFELEGDLIRAGHGHSIPVAGLRTCEPKGPLFHATTKAALPKVKADGLKSMSRQKVHLSYDKAITIEAARRRSRDVVLVEVDTGAARLANVGFYESADPRIVLSDDLPAKFLRFPT
jgi:putative RNA 2'-phosphotransferase